MLDIQGPVDPERRADILALLQIEPPLKYRKAIRSLQKSLQQQLFFFTVLPPFSCAIVVLLLGLRRESLHGAVGLPQIRPTGTSASPTRLGSDARDESLA